MNRDENALRVVEAPNLDAIQIADHAWDFYACIESCKVLNTRAGKPFVVVTLSDQTRTMEGKIWSERSHAMEEAQRLRRGSKVKVRGKAEDYEGKFSMKIEQLRATDPERDRGVDLSALVDPALLPVEDLVTGTLVIDIETVPANDFDSLPDSVADALEKHAHRKDSSNSEDEIQARIGMAMGLSPLFGKVVSIALGDGENPDAEVHVLATPHEKFPVSQHPSWLRLMSEQDMLRAFWALASKAEVVVTFNGRSFDVPFLQGRSLVLGVPVRCDLLSGRFSLKPHLDLFELLKQGDKAPSKLEVICWALGVESPKGEMDGSKVAPTYARGDIVKIAEYNRHDVRATAEVYRKVRDGILRFRGDWK
jgi:predicted PolB exonuclease-like 3'-5' exonuclease